MRERIFQHVPHLHTPRNPNAIHQEEQATSGFNQRLAIMLTKAVGTMTCAYVFALLAVIGFPGLLGPQISLYVQWISQTFIQLTMLSILMVGQSVLSRKQEIQADEAYKTTLKSFHDIEQIMAHLDAQDVEVLKIAQSVGALALAVDKLVRRVDAATGRGAA